MPAVPRSPEQILAAARAWRDGDPDLATRAELETLLAAGDLVELTERFGSNLEFGTAGLRGLLGAGTNRMNQAVVIRTTAGLARYLLEVDPDVRRRGVVVGRDARRGSREFTQQIAAVLAAVAIPVHVFEDMVPTPLVSFAVRDLGASAGVMVTASHNPPEYNGYKVYWSNAAQIVPPHDARIAEAIDRVGAARDVPRVSFTEGQQRGLILKIRRDVKDRYYAAILACSRRKQGREGLRVVYTPLHGVGDLYVHELFERFGFPTLISVPEQAAPDGTFPTVRFPNPEEPGALDLALVLAKREKADIVLANDPDADRLAVAVPNSSGDWVALNGNEIGVLLAHYLLTDDPTPAADRLVVTTIVSSPLLGLMARELGARYDETLTGFKWIVNRALALEAEHGTTFVMGYEEALGYTVGTVARDKDGVGAAALFAELAAWVKHTGDTVLGRLEKIYRRFGLVVSRQRNVTRPGSEGAAQIKREMDAVRRSPPQVLAGEEVVAVRDYLARARTGIGEGTTSELNLPPSDVLAFELAGGSRITMRPSGTEPKIKYYMDVVEPLRAEEAFETGRARACVRLDALEKAFVAFAAEAGT